MATEPTPLLAEDFDPEQQQQHEQDHLSLKRHKSRSSFIADTSTMLSGIMAEEVAEFNHLDRISTHRSLQTYGAVDSELNNDGNSDQPEDEDDDDDEPEYLVPKHQLYVILPCIFSLVFLAALDSTILSTLLTTVSSELNAIPYISWIASSYLLSCSIIQPLGKLSDIFGRKPMLLMCIFVFTIGCLQCSLATSALSFAIGRFLSGFAGGLNTLGTIILSDLIPLRKRGVFQGIANIFYAIGSAVGGACGGLIAEKFGWRAAFGVQCPIGIFVFLLIWYNLHLPQLEHQVVYQKASMKEKFKKIDITGIIALSAMLFLFVMLTSIDFATGNQFALVAVLFVIALYFFLKLELTNKDPIVPIGLLKDRSVLGSSLSNMFGSVYIFSLLYYYPVYQSTVLNLDAKEIGILLIPSIILCSLASVLSGLYMKWTGKYLMFAIVCTSLGSLGIVWLMIRTYPFDLKVIPAKFELIYLFMLPQSSYSVILTVTLLSLIASVPIESQSAVTSIQYAFRGIGSTAGASLSSFVFNYNLKNMLTSKLTEHRPNDFSDEKLEKLIHTAVHNADFIHSSKAPDWSVRYLVESYGISCWSTFLFSFAMSVLCLLTVFLIKEYKLHSTIKRK
ncbi:unnamed protein product [Ambrosiozyma monospora]|uniref:Unnamed protein product n=1 Tax=Ambrosiozyma monospora TaxID=43982 RepID=A0A9W6YXT5_AMBMO|nr:unnamed protein product [Ambrosiozyma monospora]